MKTPKAPIAKDAAKEPAPAGSMQRVARRRRSEFGDWMEIPMPEDCDIVIVAVNTNGLVPKTLLLPHQVYVKHLQEMMKEPGAFEVTAIPARSKDYVNVWPPPPSESSSATAK